MNLSLGGHWDKLLLSLLKWVMHYISIHLYLQYTKLFFMKMEVAANNNNDKIWKAAEFCFFKTSNSLIWKCKWLQIAVFTVFIFIFQQSRVPYFPSVYESGLAMLDSRVIQFFSMNRSSKSVRDSVRTKVSSFADYSSGFSLGKMSGIYFITDHKKQNEDR